MVTTLSPEPKNSLHTIYRHKYTYIMWGKVVISVTPFTKGGIIPILKRD